MKKWIALLLAVLLTTSREFDSNTTEKMRKSLV